MRHEFAKIVTAVQATESCHQKYIQTLYKLYEENEFDRFVKYFNLFLENLFRRSERLPFIARGLKFCSRFCAELAQKEEDEDNQPFLTASIKYALKFTNLVPTDYRLNSCTFIALVLQNIGDRVMLDSDLCKKLEKAMLERIHDSRPAIRVKAIAAMIRLQEPSNLGCPVVKSCISMMYDTNALVRREATKIIAISPTTVCKVKDRIRDVDSSVRMVAYKKLAEVGPRFFSIADRHAILTSGFGETDNKVSEVFRNCLLTTWLRMYNDNLLLFVGATKLTAAEEDLKVMVYLSKNLMKHFFSTKPIDDIISILPLNENKLIDMDAMKNDVTLCWNLIVKLINSSGEYEEYLGRILPELVTFSTFIETFVKEKIIDARDEDVLMEEQFNLMNLLEIAATYDYSDEVGRRKIQSVVQSILPNKNMSLKLIQKLVFIYGKCSSSIEFLTTEMCQIISEIKEPLVEQPISEEAEMELKYQIANLRVKINELQEEQTEALRARDYQLAEATEKQLIETREALKQLQEVPTVVHVQQATQATMETVCRCLNVLMALLQLPQVDRITSSLAGCKDEFLLPLVPTCTGEAHWRILTCLGLFAVIDRQSAEEFAKGICIPLITYKMQPDADVQAVVKSIGITCDLIRIYGIGIVGGDELENTNGHSTKRRLYTGNADDLDSMNIESPENINYPGVVNTWLDMLDAEISSIRYAAVDALYSLILCECPITSAAISRIILKWFDPSTGRDDPELEMRLGVLLDQFSKMKSAKPIIMGAVIPTLSAIADAPRGTSLVDIPMENLLDFMAAILNAVLSQEELRQLALEWCERIEANANDRIVVYLTKLLLCLDIKPNERNVELGEKITALLPNTWNKMRQKQLTKFATKITTVEKVADATQNTTGRTTISAVAQRVTDVTENTLSTHGIELSQNTVRNTTALETITEVIEDKLSISDSDTENDPNRDPNGQKKRKRFSNRPCFVRLERVNDVASNGSERRLSTRRKKKRYS